MTTDMRRFLALLLVGCLYIGTLAYLWADLGCSTSAPC